MDAIGRVQTSGVNLPAKTQAKAPVEKKEESVPVQTQDSFVRGVLKEAGEMAVKVGNVTSSSLGGAIGLVGLTAGLYAGAAGGALFLGALGGGIGPVISAVTTKGLLAFMGSSLKTAGLFAKTGIALGGVATGIGAFQIARKSADVIGKIPGMIIGGAIGLVTGTIHQIEKRVGGGA